MRILTLGLVLLAGCSLYPFDGGGDDVCEQIDLAQPAPDRKVNPNTLACQEFSNGPTCSGECGPCAGGAPYNPPWGRCESECTGLGEAACTAAPNCRVARVFDAYYRGQPSFEGCYEVSPFGGGSGAPQCEGEDAETCSRHSECTGLYSDYVVADCGPNEDCADFQFRECIDEAQAAGTCNAQVTCRALPPTCPGGTTPGVADGCWTGSCIPNSLCTPGI